MTEINIAEQESETCAAIMNCRRGIGKAGRYFVL
jgi:hypothetical protein